MVYATLSNSNRPGSPAVTVGFPITENVYADLESIGIGSATERDCYAASVGGDVPILKRLEKTAVNVDELDYLVKRLDSFDRRELAQFQGVAVSRGYFDMTDLINLTFCCQSATVVQDFSDLASIGRAHYLDIHGGATAEELQSVDTRKLALSLLLNEDGTGARAEVARGRDVGQQLHRHPRSCGRVALRREDAPEHYQHHGFQGGSDLQGPAGGGSAGAAVLQKSGAELSR